MTTKCWRCGKRRKTLDGAKVSRLFLTSFSPYEVVLELPNPVCRPCFNGFVKWATENVVTK